MNQLVEQLIISRKEAIYNYYEVVEVEHKEKIENLFNQIMEFGKDYKDSQKFETDFATSSFNQEYINLFTELSQTCKIKEIKQTTNENDKGYGIKEAIVDTIATEAELKVRDATMPYRRKMYQETMSKLRSMPIIGDLLHAKQTKDFIDQYKKKKR